MKTCTKCKVPKDESNFTKGNDKNGRRYLCKECHSRVEKERREAYSSRSEVVLPDSKVCCACLVSREASFFRKAKSKPSGLSSRCKICKSEKYFADLRKPRIAVLAKTCPRCGLSKEAELFHKSRGNRDGLHAWCRSCSAKNNRETYNPDRHREYNMKKVHGITPKQAESVFVFQGRRCPVCLEESPKGKRKWVVDHDHKCEEGHPRTKSCLQCLRGILCQNCNIMMGHAKDNPDTLARAISYLANPPAKEILNPSSPTSV